MELDHSKSDSSQEGTMDAKGGQSSEKKPSKIKTMWSKTGLDIGTLIMMVKAAVPPTVATALYQWDAFASHYTTLGFLVSIMSILGMAIMPRAKFIQTMLFNVIGACLGVAIGLLAIWTGIKARQHTTPPGAPLVGYNPSASTVMGIWLTVQIFLTNAIRSARPQFQLPCIIYSIFAIVSSTYGPLMTTMTAAISFEKRLLEAFLTGFGIASVVSLLFFPVTARTVVFKTFTGYLKGMQAVLKAQVDYLHSLETHDIFGPLNEDQDSGKTEDVKGDSTGSHSKKKSKSAEIPPHESPSEASALQSAVQSLLAVHTKLNGDLAFAKRETAFGKLGSSDMQELFRLIRRVMIPLIGLSSMVDIFERVGRANFFPSAKGETDSAKSERIEAKTKATNEWQRILKSLHEPFSEITDTVSQGLQHALLQLQLEPPPKHAKGDVEAEAQLINPGDKGFADHLENKIATFYKEREVTLREWCEQKGIDASPGTFDQEMHDAPVDVSDGFSPISGSTKQQASFKSEQRQLFMLLFLEYLMYNASTRVLHIVRFADGKVEQGRMSKRRFIVPTSKTVKKWIHKTFQPTDDTKDDHLVMDAGEGSQTVYLGDAFYARRDPEHLPPATAWEHIGNYLRIIPHTLKSPHAAFGLRAACATMSIGVVAFLRDSYMFFIQQRLLWAMIMVAFSMSRTSGQSAFNFILRVGGTVLATIASYVVWYIVNGETAGVIVFMFVWVFICFYIPLKMPKYTPVGIIASVTVVLVVGYELQVRKLGVKTAESNGQPAYPLYQLAPYRLATVAGGIAVAYIWTILPFPITENYHLRQNLGGALFLLAKYYSVIHETVKLRIDGDEGDPDDKTSQGRRLEKARNEIFAKTQAIVGQLQASSAFSKWQINFGGKFPRETYDHIISLVQKILNYVALMGFASETFSDANTDDIHKNQWLSDFRKVITSISGTTNEVTSLLSVLSSSVTSGQPLPPFLRSPDPYQLLSKLEAVDKDILSVTHIAEPGYSAFAVMQVASRTVVADLEALVGEVRKLVGELDFSYHDVISTTDGTTGETEIDMNKEKIRRPVGKKDQ